MNCVKCGQELDAGASFCGNCGAPVVNTATRGTSEVSQNEPSTAPIPEGGGKAIASLVLGILGIVAWIYPPVGLIIGILSIVFGTMTVKSNKKAFAIAGIVLGSITIIISLLLGGYVISESIKSEQAGSFIGGAYIDWKNIF